MCAKSFRCQEISAACGPRRRGFTLLELLFALGILAVVGLISVKLFRSTVLVSQGAETAAASMTRMDSALASIRRDAWGAESIQVGDAKSVTLQQPGGASVRWHAEHPGEMVRDEAGKQTHWSALPGGITFAVDGAVLVVQLTGTPDHPGGETRMPSQVLLAAEDKP